MDGFVDAIPGQQLFQNVGQIGGVFINRKFYNFMAKVTIWLWRFWRWGPSNYWNKLFNLELLDFIILIGLFPFLGFQFCLWMVLSSPIWYFVSFLLQFGTIFVLIICLWLFIVIVSNE